MIKLLNKVPKNVTIALSGGPDSMSALHFLKKGNREIRAIYFNHLTNHGQEAELFVKDYCKSSRIPLILGRIQSEKLPSQSKEEYWRIERHKFFKEYSCNNAGPIVTAHHLDDAIEWWIFSSLHGEGKLIPNINIKTNVIRPFLLNKKEQLVNYLIKNGIPFIQDPSNSNNSHMRNYIRNTLMPQALIVNPGLAKTIMKKYL